MTALARALVGLKKLWSHTRGSSEAVSQALLFMVIISTAAGISIVGGDFLDDIQGEESLNQAVTSFEDLDEIVSEMNSLGSDNRFTTAARSGSIRSINAELHHQDPVNITIDTGDEYVIKTRPLVVRNLDYSVAYESGIVQSQTFERTTVIRTPADRSHLNPSMLLFTSVAYADDAEFTAGDTQPMLISQRSPPEVLSLDPGDSIELTTDRPDGWVAYFEDHPRLTDVAVDSTGGSRSEIRAQVDASDSVTVHVEFIKLEPTSR